MSSSKLIRLRKLSLILQIASFTCFINGLMLPALCIRLFVEAARFPWFYKEGIKDQIALSAFVFVGCIYGILRVTLGI